MTLVVIACIGEISLPQHRVTEFLLIGDVEPMALTCLVVVGEVVETEPFLSGPKLDYPRILVGLSRKVTVHG
jgi:hypothetical protein